MSGHAHMPALLLSRPLYLFLALLQEERELEARPRPQECVWGQERQLAAYN